MKKVWFGIFLLAWLGLALAACTTPPASGEGTTTRWEGTVEAILPDGLQVSGRLVRWTGQTQILGEIQVGSRVEVEGIPTGETLNAAVIRVQPSSGSAVAMGGTAAGTFVSPLPTPTSPIEFRGVVEAALPDGYRVSGQTVIVTATTRIEGPVAVGAFVKVKGILLADGSVLALQIQVEAPEAEIELKGMVEAILPDGYQVAGRTVIVTTTTRIEGPIAVGTFVKVKGIVQPDGTILASRIQREEEERPEIEFQGVVEEILPNGYRIAGHIVVVTTTTRIEGSITVGAFVKVEGIPQPDGTILATHIRLQEEVRFTGVVEAILSNGYRVSGRTVVVTDLTKVKDPVAVGDWVEVKGFLQGDGSILAREIRVKKAPKSIQVEFKGTVEEILPNGYRVSGITVVVTTTTRVDGPIAVGTFVEVKGVFQPDGSVLALHIHVERPEREKAEVEFKGTVEELLPNGYRVSGRTVAVTTTTRIDGPITVGTFVEVKGILQPDGTILALRIHVEDEDEAKGEVEFKGAVEEILPDGYRIAGRIVRVDANTRIDGAITAGAFVEVKGFVQGDGSIRAVRIHLEGDHKNGGGKIEDGKKGDDGRKGEEGRKGDDGKSGEEDHKDHEDDD
ncbi:hypothetical protein HRbin22_00745 [Candidatus Thermoflexus japonica]|uniref:DUF5666 domain-containing protein n=1 Tax=Candidatus Thermoflexus japonica TaxID=2035417 RepID=A0A2H5Y4Y9_9CHLR|nr:hypothetical protein HRbin22_00745 [Candidatus Thermoflexus japonica]